MKTLEIASTKQLALPFKHEGSCSELIPHFTPYYTTRLGMAYLNDALEIMKDMPDGSVNVVITSPPYALHFKKEYGNVSKAEYIEWFLPFARQIFRILSEDGSFVLNIGGSYNKGLPTRSLYHFKLLIELVEEVNFHLAQECFWYNPAKMPMPAEWVTVRRIRIKDSIEYIWWLSKTAWPKANNRSVLREYSKDMHRLNLKGLNSTKRPSGHNIKPSFSKTDPGGAIPPNVVEESLLSDDTDYPSNILKFGNNAANDIYTLRCKDAGIKPHPARFPSALPEFFIQMLTDKGDLVLDPFAGSNTTGAVAEKLERSWVAIENVQSYIEASRYRF